MEDSELEAIRQKRLAELRASAGAVRGNTPERDRLEREQAERMEEQRKVILQQLLTNEARERRASSFFFLEIEKRNTDEE